MQLAQKQNANPTVYTTARYERDDNRTRTRSRSFSENFSDATAAKAGVFGTASLAGAAIASGFGAPCISITDNDENERDVFDELEVFEIIRHINDPEHPLTLEQVFSFASGSFLNGFR